MWTETNSSNSVEFPAVGYRNDDSSGTLNDVGQWGEYWSSVVDGSNNTYIMIFLSSNLGVNGGYNKQYGLSVRCVR